MQRDGRELADVFNGAVPGKAVVKIGNDAQIDAMHARFFEYVLNHAALAGSGEKNLVDELLACVLEERVEGADDIPARGHHVRGSAGELDKAFERVAEVTNAIEVMAQGMCFCARFRR